MTTLAISFTPLESLLLFQSILKHGVEPEVFPRIASALQSNPFVRNDNSFNADRLTADSLQQLFLRLLRDELADDDDISSDHALSNGKHAIADIANDVAATATSKKRKISAALPTLNDARAHAQQLPALVERLYARYRDFTIASIREDERRIEKIQAELCLLEQDTQTEELGRQPASAKPSDGSTASTSNGHIRPHTQAEVRPGDVTANANGTSAASRHATLSSSTPESLTPVPQRGVPTGVPLLPAQARTAIEPSVEAPHSLSRPTDSPALQQHQLQAEASLLTPRQLSPFPIAQSQPPSRALAVATPAEPLSAIGAGTLPPTAVPTGLASRSLSPARTAHLPPQSFQQPILPAAVKSQPGTTSLQASQSQTPVPVSPSRAQSTTHHTEPVSGQSLAQSSQGSTVGTRIDGPRHLAPATPKHIPIAPGLQASLQPQRTPGSAPSLSIRASQAVGGPPTRDNAMHGVAARPALLDHIRPGPPSRTPTPVQSPHPVLPHTPIQGALVSAGFLPRGSGTRWKYSDPTPSTPRPDVGDIASPAYEPLSPMRPNNSARGDSVDATDDASVSPSMPTSSRQRILRRPQSQSQHSRQGHKSTRSSRPLRHAKAHGESTDDDGFAIKAEVSTPRPFDDLAEATEDTIDSPGGHVPRALKRKHGDSFDSLPSGKPDESVLARRRLVGPPTPPTHVLWTRGFPKISASALDQISSHRHANMFAHKIRDRDAPGYGSIVRHPVDLKSIRMAISHGNKAATTMAATLSESDQAGASSLWLPTSEDLVPPRGIINSSQLECELVHMFANAIMYNPDSHRGPGPAFTIQDPAEDDAVASSGMGGDGGASGSAARYKVDEDGVVNDTRAMYVEVEKLLSEMRSAERQRGMPAPPPDAKGLDLPLDDGTSAGVGGGGDEDEENTHGGGGDTTQEDAEAAGTGGTGGGAADVEGSGTAKRRRITRG